MHLTELRLRLLYRIDAAQAATREQAIADIGISASTHRTPLEATAKELRQVSELCDELSDLAIERYQLLVEDITEVEGPDLESALFDDVVEEFERDGISGEP
ncbi:hypothetical protein [Leptolyngbya sp. FACHB-261]|uniref:hypothetical protein n=1 Tax=Leptolyngbya sp. FACHB-261 TaxID=2692806 RepID=UPI0016845280|nr:hypothetical protein [Leptolyngbya sp. FACHB-261]MBD2105316.1 hypothetical protein [Leptolyngbya sp. FACHB-261]